MTDAPRTETDLERWERTNNILGEIFEEREQQFEKWGDQLLRWDDPQDPTGVHLMGRSYTDFEQMAKQRCDAYRNYSAQPGRPDIRNNALVLIEEVFEALAAKDPANVRAELIQVAAVAVKAVEALDRHAGVGPQGPVVIDDVPRTTDVFLPGDNTISLRVQDDQIPTDAQVRAAVRVINDPKATTDDVAAADALLRHAEDEGARS